MEILVDENDLRALARAVATSDQSGGQFVQWVVHSKPSTRLEEQLQALHDRV